MPQKIGTWMIAVGCFFAFAGLCFLTAALGSQGDSSLLSAAAMIFSTGMVLAAAGFYFKARSYSELAPAKKPHLKPNQKLCDQCHKQEAAIHCRVHDLSLCPDCLATHYDFKSCAYVPASRQTAHKPKARAHSTSA
ncbi:MAG: hypothetical protein WBQ72_00840 [Terriglobales bacterium]|jgi:hypothetical protein